eukprot:PITA_01842
MICLSFNCRGLANPDKRLALRDLLAQNPFDILFLQEALGVGLEVTTTLTSFLPDWNFITLDARGRSGGCALGINNKTTQMINCWGRLGVLAMNVPFGCSETEFTLVNFYGPCSDRESFWHSLLSCSLLRVPHFFLGGDMNFSLGIVESWGPQATPDPLDEFFNSNLSASHLVDIHTTKIQPNLRNRRTGSTALARRLDRFLIKQALLPVLSCARQWVDQEHFRPTMDCDTGRAINENLIHIKNLTIHWVRNKKKLEREALCSIEEKIGSLNRGDLLGYSNEDVRAQLFALETEKAKLLRQKEEDWRLKIRAIWLQACDENTKFFQQHANGRKAANTIWELSDRNGFTAKTHAQITELDTKHFSNMYRASTIINLPDILRITQNFKLFIEQERKDDLNAPVTLGELEGVLKWFKQDKSPGPDGWPIEFFIHFFDLISADLLAMIEDSRVRGRIYDGFKTTFIAFIPKSDKPTSFNEFRPISLCNYIYKIISKIIANHIKPFMSTHIEKEQFAFLNHRQIHEAIGIA